MDIPAALMENPGIAGASYSGMDVRQLADDVLLREAAEVERKGRLIDAAELRSRQKSPSDPAKNLARPGSLLAKDAATPTNFCSA